MNVNLSIKSVPAEWAERLRARAARNHRSLQGELMALLEAALREEEAAALARAGRAPLRRGSRPIEEIAAEHRTRFPKPISGGPRSVDIVRALRNPR